MKDLIAVADSHLTRGDFEVKVFTDFLRREGSSAGVVAHLGDLFNIWLGRPRFEMEHMGQVLETFRDLRRGGVRTILVEGNREFHVRPSYEGDVFDEVAEDGAALTVGPRRVRLSHGDLVNVLDKQYRAWRRFSKSAALWAAVGLMPSGAGIRLAERLESRLRGTNVRHKSHFPEGPARDYAEEVFRQGHDLLLLGHFHEERVLRTGRGTVVVLPDWRSSHRYLRVKGDGTWVFEHWEAR